MATTKHALDSGRYAYDGLDRVIHEKARLGILTSLIGHAEGLPFNDLKALCRLTDGNLSRHLTILHEAGLIEIQKGKQDNRSHTHVRITSHGRERFAGYLSVLENVIRDAHPGEQHHQPNAYPTPMNQPTLERERAGSAHIPVGNLLLPARFSRPYPFWSRGPVRTRLSPAGASPTSLRRSFPVRCFRT